MRTWFLLQATQAQQGYDDACRVVVHAHSRRKSREPSLQGGDDAARRPGTVLLPALAQRRKVTTPKEGEAECRNPCAAAAVIQTPHVRAVVAGEASEPRLPSSFKGFDLQYLACPSGLCPGGGRSVV